VRATLTGDTAPRLAAADEALGRGARAADLIDQLTDLRQGLLVTAAGGQPADRTAEERRAAGRARARLRRRPADGHARRARRGLAPAAPARRRAPVAEMAVVEPRACREAGRAERAAGRRARHAPAAPPALAAGRDAEPRCPHAASAPRGGRGRRLQRRSPPPAASDDFTARFVAEAGQGSRSLRAELQRYRRSSVQGDELVLQPRDRGRLRSAGARAAAKLEAAALAVAGAP
jgi:hypothetical protein